MLAEGRELEGPEGVEGVEPEGEPQGGDEREGSVEEVGLSRQEAKRPR